MIKTKRVYDPAEVSDGRRFLVDRVWPRGKRKDAMHLESWLKDAAPSTELRRWFNHDPDKWEEFRNRYWAELDTNKGNLDPIRSALQKGPVTLLYSAHDLEHNNAVALKQYLEKRKR